MDWARDYITKEYQLVGIVDFGPNGPNYLWDNEVKDKQPQTEQHVVVFRRIQLHRSAFHRTFVVFGLLFLKLFCEKSHGDVLHQRVEFQFCKMVMVVLEFMMSAHSMKQ